MQLFNDIMHELMLLFLLIIYCGLLKDLFTDSAHREPASPVILVKTELPSSTKGILVKQSFTSFNTSNWNIDSTPLRNYCFSYPVNISERFIKITTS
jgi:hypothetical protein